MVRSRGIAAIVIRCSVAAALLEPWALSGCGSAARAGPEPEASLAGSSEAQAEFRALREQWIGAPLDSRAALEPALTRFVQRHPTDHQGRWARIYLAWIARERKDLALATRWLDLAEPGPAGAASDLLGVVRASVDLAAGRAQAAYTKLSELDGRLIDADDRLLCLDQLVLAALAVERYDEAVQHMLELAAQAARRHRDRTWRSLEPRLARIPLPLLEASLPTISASAIESPSLRPAEKAAAADWMRRQILELLSRSAITQKNVELAQRLVASAAAREGDDARESELLRLATRGGLSPAVVGRTLGLLLQLGEPTLRQRSMEVAAGIASTLDLANADPERGLLLETREVESDGDVAATLMQLAGDGAGLLAAGLDPASARSAADFSARTGLCVLLLHEPAGDLAALPPCAFVVGADEVSANEPLRRALLRRFDTLTSVGGGATPCHAEAAAQISGAAPAQGIGVFGDAPCAREVFANLGDAGRSWTVGLGLDALAAQGDERAPAEIWVLGVGKLPHTGSSSDPQLLGWWSKQGRPPSFYEALGHDIALLGAVALPVAPPTKIREAERVLEHHRAVLARLQSSAIADLWTSDGPRFGKDQRWPREFKAVPLNTRARAPAAGGPAPASPRPPRQTP